MKIVRLVVFGAAIALAAVGQASAQDWPTRSVTVVVPIPAGVASDIIARVVFEQVGKQVGQTFVIESARGRWYDRRQHGRQGRAGRPYHSGLWLDSGGQRTLMRNCPTTRLLISRRWFRSARPRLSW